ncbi:hypothetical protein GPALN_014643 [Globodera pallida]|nr:hypothetical protein GPALN_014643 [Globodera pallida]
MRMCSRLLQFLIGANVIAILYSAMLLPPPIDINSIAQQYRDLIPTEVTDFYNTLTEEDKYALKEVAERHAEFQTADQAMEALKPNSEKLYNKAVELRNLVTEKFDKLVPDAKAFITGLIEKAMSLRSKAGEKPNLEELRKGTNEIIEKFKALSEEAKESLKISFPKITEVIPSQWGFHFISHTNAAYIDSAVNAIATVSSGSADVLMSLNALGLVGAFFLKAIVPVGAPESDVFKQLMDLKTRTDEIWRSNERAIQASVHAIGMKIMTNQYFVKVVQPINIMKTLTNRYVDPTIFKQEMDVNEYKRMCKYGEKAPEEILTYLLGRLVTSCNEPMSADEVQKLANHRAYLTFVTMRFKVAGGEMPDVGLYLKEYLSIYKSLGGNKGILDLDTLNVFKHSFVSYSAAFKAYFLELRRRGSIKNRSGQIEDCFLRELLLGVNFNFQRVEAYCLQLRDELIDLGYIAGICADLSFGGHGPSVEKYVKAIADLIESIATHTTSWINRSLESAWPELHQQILLEQLTRIVRDPGQMTKRNLQIVLELALPKLAVTGTQNFAYQCLIAKTANQENYFEGMAKFCNFQKDVFGFDTIVSRIALNSTNELEKENVHAKMVDMAYYSANLNATIQESMGTLYNTDNLTLIATTLKARMGTMVISKKNFHCWTVLRAYAAWPWDTCPTIEYAIASYGYGELHGTATLPYQNSGSLFQVCEIFRFIFAMYNSHITTGNCFGELGGCLLTAGCVLFPTALVATHDLSDEQDMEQKATLVHRLGQQQQQQQRYTKL